VHGHRHLLFPLGYATKPLSSEGGFFVFSIFVKTIDMAISIPGSTPTAPTSARFWKIGSTEYRMTIRDGELVTDKLLANGTWPGTKDVDWENVDSVS